MASTRNHNTRENYNMETKRNINLLDYRFYKYSPNSIAYTTQLQGNGLSIAKIHPKELSNNYMDIDCYLKGLGSCNLIENNQTTFYPSFKQVSHLHMYQKDMVLLPVQPNFPKNQRPFFV